jgi:hypothetical protein
VQTVTEEVMKLSPPGGLFDTTVVRNLFPDATEGARKVLVHRAVQAGEILRLKPGLYILKKEYRKSEAHPYAVAAMLHWPSHVSVETALSHHGLIPEAVFQVASVTAARSRQFDTPLGLFTFQRVPAQVPIAGVEALKVEGGTWAFVATPLRAIADTVYLHRQVSWNSDGLSFLTESLRIEVDDLASIDFSPGQEIRDSLRDERTRDYLLHLEKELA